MATMQVLHLKMSSLSSFPAPSIHLQTHILMIFGPQLLAFSAKTHIPIFWAFRCPGIRPATLWWGNSQTKPARCFQGELEVVLRETRMSQVRTSCGSDRSSLSYNAIILEVPIQDSLREKSINANSKSLGAAWGCLTVRHPQMPFAQWSYVHRTIFLFWDIIIFCSTSANLKARVW